MELIVEKRNESQPQFGQKLESIWEKVSCNLCGGQSAKTKYEGTTDQDMERMLKSYSASGNFVSKETLVECLECGLIYTSPRLKRDLILKGYTETEDPLYVSQEAGRIKSFERCLRSVQKYKLSGKVLDIGAASGFFLKVAKDSGFETYGIEPSKYLSDYGNKKFGVNISCGTVETCEEFKNMDVVTLWDVLEHTFDPKDVLKRCNHYLKKGGIVVINYPNISNWMARLAGRNYWFILSVHLYYFVPKTIRAFLKATGYRVLEEGPHFQWLELGYLIYRLEAYSPKISKLMAKVVSMLGLKNLLIPYYAAQTRIIAEKVEDV